MNVKSVVRNFTTAFLAQGIAMLMSFIQSLIIPKLLDASSYGYWQLFIFYSSYVGIFHFGLNDGVYLLEGGTARDKIDKSSISSQFVFSMAFESCFSIVLAIFALSFSVNLNRSFVLCLLCVYLVIKNAADYLSFTLQAMNETRLSSYSIIVERVSFIVFVLGLLLLRSGSFHHYIVAFVIACSLRLCFCAYQMREFFVAGLRPIRETLSLSRRSITTGISLMLANIASGLVIGIARFGIDAAWDISLFGEISFSLSLVYFFMSFVQQASMVLFPALRQSAPNELTSFFRNAQDAMGLLFPAAYLLYYPMTWILELWLPRFSSSFVFFAYLIPVCVFDSKMDITCSTVFKVTRQEKTLFKINVAAAALSLVGTLVSILVFHSIIAVIATIVLSIISRSILSESLIASQLKVPRSPITVAELVLTLLFLVSSQVLPGPTAFLFFLVAYLLFLAFFRKQLSALLFSARHALNKE